MSDNNSNDNIILKVEGLKKVFGDHVVLENINTTKQLKDNFPEAYVILTETSKEDVKRNECDNIEKLRAELSKL